MIVIRIKVICVDGVVQCVVLLFSVVGMEWLGEV